MMPSPADDVSRILFIEDDPDIRAVTELALEDVGGFTVRSCESGEVGLQEAPGFAPDLVLLDVMMPDMDGPETLQALRNLRGLHEVPVIFMTARLQESEVEHYLDLGAVGVIPKPFDPMTLADTIRHMLSGH